MKTRLSPRRPPAAGYALLVVLIFTTVILIILAGTIGRTSSNALLNERNNQSVISVAAAEAATEMAYSRLSLDYISGGIPLVTQNLPAYKTRFPGSQTLDDPTGNNYWASFSFSDGTTPNQTYVALTSSSTNWQWWPNLDSQFQNMGGYVLTYRILSNARKTDGRFNITGAVQQDIQVLQIPLFQFAIFYNSLLEFSTAATMTVTGPVHANGDIYVGSSSTLTFNSDVSSTGNTFIKTPWAGQTISTSSTINYNGGNPRTNTTSLVLPIGTNNTPDAVHEVVNIPPTGEAASSSMGLQRFYNKAQFNIIVSNNSVTAWVKRVNLNNNSVLATAPVLWTNLTYFINTNNTSAFIDQRENASKPVGLTQIDIGKYNTWGRTNTAVQSTLGTDANGNGLVPNDIWIADFRTCASNEMFAVRLTNGVAVPTNNAGLTIATPNPLYVIGDYNCPNSAYRGTTNTSASVPCSFICDALTVLSSAWQDSASSGAYNSGTRNNPTDNTTLNVSFVAGAVYSTGSGINQFSGGVHNLPRMLENWTSHNLWLNTSIVNLYPSYFANGLFVYPGQAGTYYNPPTRHFAFDVRLTDPNYQPPGTPMLSVPRRLVWSTPPPGVVNYNGL